MRVVDDLKDAKAKIKVLKYYVEHKKLQTSRLEKSVVMLKMQKTDCQIATRTRSHKLDAVEVQRVGMKRINCTRKTQNSLGGWILRKSSQFSMLEDLEVGEIKNEVAHLRGEKKNLENLVKTLQFGRCSDVVELVYLRWLNACLRYELRNYEPPQGKTISRDLTKSLSPKTEVDNQWDMHQSMITCPTRRKLKIFDKLRGIITRKENTCHNDMHYKASTSVKSCSCQDLGTTYSYVCNEIQTWLGLLGHRHARRTSSIPAWESQLAKGLELGFDYSDLVRCGETLKVSSQDKRTQRK
ncbi:hypothetical protein V2J09_022692 [Rumex salicifolius]